MCRVNRKTEAIKLSASRRSFTTEHPAAAAASDASEGQTSCRSTEPATKCGWRAGGDVVSESTISTLFTTKCGLSVD